LRLRRNTLGLLPSEVRRPGYDPAAVGVGIVHLGIGAFHRAHQAAYVDDLIARYGGDWRIIGVSLRSSTVRDQLADQDCLYTLVERDSDEDRLRVIGAVADVLVASEDPSAVIDAIAADKTQIVSLTVTEKGYCHDPATGTLNPGHADIVHDLANRNAPRSAIGYLAAGLDARRRSEGCPLSILSCDNLPRNGTVLRSVLLDFAERCDTSLAKWIDANVAFPATMVDRIVPATTDADRSWLAGRLGLLDAAMVKAEPFSQWVIEDQFASRRPAFECVGAQIVADVRPFELAKLRMLNGSHSTIAYLGLLYGHNTVDRAIADVRIMRVVDDLMTEAAATLPRVPGLDPAAYAQALKARFANTALEHRLTQIAMDGSQKLPQRLLGTIADTHADGGEPRASATGVAAWMRHFDGPYVNDPLAERLRAMATSDTTRLVEATLGVTEVFGELGRERWLRDLLIEVMP
jgi:fructuronate reductase